MQFLKVLKSHICKLLTEQQFNSVKPVGFVVELRATKQKGNRFFSTLRTHTGQHSTPRSL